jgi:hypothetical protein
MCCLKNYFEAGARGRDIPVHTMRVHNGSRDINPLIHKLVIRQSSLVSLMLWPLLPEKDPLYELNSRMGGSQNQSGYLREEKNFLHLAGNQTLTFWHQSFTIKF